MDKNFKKIGKLEPEMMNFTNSTIGSMQFLGIGIPQTHQSRIAKKTQMMQHAIMRVIMIKIMIMIKVLM